MNANPVALSPRPFDLPTEVEAVFRAFWTCELSTRNDLRTFPG